MERTRNAYPPSNKNSKYSWHLTAKQIAMIDEALNAVGEFGEIRLVINRGQIQYLVTSKSFTVRNYRTGMIRNK
jgi:hypothetical protein